MLRSLVAVALAMLLGCSPEAGSTRDTLALKAAAKAAADSAISMPYLTRQFQAKTGQRPTSLAEATSSREELVRRFVGALERSDGSALERLRVTPAEFSWLFFPESIFMRPPYELDPSVVWLQIDAGSATGLHRALARLGGRPLGYIGLVCRPPQKHGSMTVHGCDVRRTSVAGDTVVDRLFGGILERDGQFKFLSLENRL